MEKTKLQKIADVLAGRGDSETIHELSDDQSDASQLLESVRENLRIALLGEVDWQAFGVGFESFIRELDEHASEDVEPVALQQRTEPPPDSEDRAILQLLSEDALTWSAIRRHMIGLQCSDSRPKTIRERLNALVARGLIERTCGNQYQLTMMGGRLSMECPRASRSEIVLDDAPINRWSSYEASLDAAGSEPQIPAGSPTCSELNAIKQQLALLQSTVRDLARRLFLLELQSEPRVDDN